MKYWNKKKKSKRSYKTNAQSWDEIYYNGKSDAPKVIKSKPKKGKR